MSKFKYEDLRVVADLIEPGDWFFTFDLRNGYYHVNIYEEHWNYLAFSFKHVILCFALCHLGLVQPLMFSLNYFVQSWLIGGRTESEFLFI